jgi:predicted small metal-binding protein
MAEHEHSVTCPTCGGTIVAATQAELIEKVQAHAKDKHGKDLSAEQVLEMERAEASK